MEEQKIIVTLTREQILLIPGALEFLYKLTDSKLIVDFVLGNEEQKSEEKKEEVIDLTDADLDTL